MKTTSPTAIVDDAFGISLNDARDCILWPRVALPTEGPTIIFSDDYDPWDLGIDSALEDFVKLAREIEELKLWLSAVAAPPVWRGRLAGRRCVIRERWGR